VRGGNTPDFSARAGSDLTESSLQNDEDQLATVARAWWIASIVSDGRERFVWVGALTAAPQRPSLRRNGPRPKSTPERHPTRRGLLTGLTVGNQGCDHARRRRVGALWVKKPCRRSVAEGRIDGEYATCPWHN
jgi:hypothetical protein